MLGIRRVFLFGLLGPALLAGCNGEPSANQPVSTKEALYKLAQMNGCLTCHRTSATVVGPSWEDIAKRYVDAPTAETRALLIERINKGSRGTYYTWKGGDGMPPMERRVSAEHIAQLVDYILALRKPPAAQQ
ncbi:MAG: c-type cytochrome [Gammaproteobacteria bacterium]|nr:c-type cytochrome [Gammaproteobacteria bacterium]